MWRDRNRYPEHNYVPDTFWLLAAALLFAACGLVWLIGQVAAILFGAHEHLPVRLVDMLGVLLRLPGTWDDPARAWPPSAQPLLPGPIGMYAAAILTFWIPAFAYGLLVRLVSPRARRRRRQRGARWASWWRLRRLLVLGPRRGRIILGRRDRIRDRLLGRLYLAVEQCHSVLAFGPPGSFKTHGLVIPAILEWQGNLVTTSIKPDVLRATCAHRANLGAVWVYDPLGLSGVPGARWTPLASCGSYADARRIGRMLAEAADVQGYKADDANYWQLLGAKLLSVLLFAAAGTGRSMADVARWVDIQDVDDVAQALMEIGNQQALDAWAACTSRPENTLGSVYGTAETLLDVFGDPVIAQSAEGCDLDLDELLTGANNTLYLYAPASEQERLRPLFELLVSVVIFKAEQLAAAQPDGMLDPRLFVCLDEAGNCAAIKKLPQLATTGRGQGIQLLTIWHDEAQLQHRYGHRASTVLNGHRAKLLLSGQADPASLELASKLVGDEAVTQTSETTGGDGRASLTESVAYRAALAETPAGTLLEVAEPTGPAWLPIAVFFAARGHIVYRVSSAKAHDLRRVLSRHAKAGGIDADTLARLPLVDPAGLYPLQLPEAAEAALDRRVRACDRLTRQAATHQRRIKDLVHQLLPASPLTGELGQADLAVLERWADPHALVAAGHARLPAGIGYRIGRPGRARNGPPTGWPPPAPRWSGTATTPPSPSPSWPPRSPARSGCCEPPRPSSTCMAASGRPATGGSTRRPWPAACPARVTIGAPALVATMGKASRFATAAKFRCFTGLAPKASETGQSDRKGHPSPRPATSCCGPPWSAPPTTPAAKTLSSPASTGSRWSSAARTTSVRPVWSPPTWPNGPGR